MNFTVERPPIEDLELRQSESRWRTGSRFVVQVAEQVLFTIVVIHSLSRVFEYY